MDPTNYGPHSPTRSFHPSPSIRGSLVDWAAHDHDHSQVLTSPWAPSHAPIPPFHHPYQRGYPMAFEPHQALTGVLPLPDPALRVYPLPYPQPGPPMHGRPWPASFPPAPVPVTAPIPPGHAGILPAVARPPFGLPPSVGRSGYPLQPPENGLGMGMYGSALEAEAHPPRSVYLQQQTASSQSPYAAPAPPPSSTNPQQMAPVPSSRRSNYHTSPGASSRVSRGPISSPPFGPLPHHHDLSGLPPFRRSAHSRARRSLSTRVAVPDLSRETEEDSAMSDHRSGPMDYRASQGSADTANDTPARQVQMLRSVVSDKKVVSKVALRLLQSVKIEDLPEKERTCVICYNDYGVETPEGINEVPLRLPKCRHVFGDHCIKRWFEESDSCPYCRDKLHSEPKLHFEGSASQAFMAMMRVRTQLPPGTTEEMYLRLMSNLVHEDFVEPREHHTSERRSYRTNGDSDSSTPDSENTATASSGTPASPIRIPQRDVPRHSQWPPRVAQQRTAHSPLGQEREVPRHRRQRYPRNNLSGGTTGPTANADGDLPTSSLPPLQTVRPDGPTQSSTDTGEMERISSLITAESQAADSLAALPVPQNRNRPW